MEYILEGLDEDYRVVIDQINGRDIPPPTLDELHEKFISRESAIMSSQSPTTFPVTANMQRNNTQPRNNSRFPPSNSEENRTPRPYLGKCQACGLQGHSAKFCTTHRIVPTSPQFSQPNWQPRAYHTTVAAP